MHASGKISPEKFERFSKQYHRIHGVQVKSFQNQQVLPSKLKKMQAEIKVLKEHYDTQLIKNEEEELKVKKMQGEVKKSELEEDGLKKIIDMIIMNLDKHKTQFADIESKIQDEIREKTNQINPLIDDENRFIESLRGDR